MAKQLRYGELVQIVDETHPCFGRVGQYEGCITGDALRVRFPGGVIVASVAQVCAYQHPVIAHRRIRAKAIRAPREGYVETPACYEKDYGPTAVERAVAAFEDALDGDNTEQVAEAWVFLQRAHFADRWPRELRRVNAHSVAQRLNSSSERRWLRTRKALRSIARQAA